MAATLPAQILVVSASPEQAERLARLLGQPGYAVTLAPDAAQALAVARQRPPALVLCEADAPGYEACAQIKADPNLKAVPVALLVSLADPAEAGRGLQAGADCLLEPPGDEAQFVARVQATLAGLGGAEPDFGGQSVSLIVSRRQALAWLQAADPARNALLQAQLEAATKELEALAHSVGHDLRAPLRAVDGFSRLLQEGYLGRLDDVGQEYLQRIRQAAQRLGQLIDAVVDLTRIARSDFHRQAVDLSALAQSIAADLQSADPGRRVEFVIAPGLAVEGDNRLLRAAVAHLFANAWKFTGPQPQARIEFGAAEREGRRVYFVSDNGVGFDSARAGRLFGAFQRQHTPAEFPGLGVGLATVQRIVHRHGGRVWAEAAVGQGATVYFTLL